ncbi:MAG: hypothetical protein ACRDJV_11535 [Actinomycetota bacterium]
MPAREEQQTSSPPTTETDVEEAAAKKSDLGNWAAMVSTLKVGEVPEGAINLNVEGRRLSSPLQGFGKLWQKSYRIPLGSDVTPEKVISEWKAHFPQFWPEGNRFFGSLTGIAPGDVAVLNLAAPGGMKLSTGILVLYADEQSFTFMNPTGHMFAGFITFSAEKVGDETTAHVQALIRASDPFFEIGMPLVMGRMEDRFWVQTLQNLAVHFGVQGEVDLQAVCVDRRRQWKYWKNVRHNAAIRSGLYTLAAPGRWVVKPFKRRP